MCLFDVMILDVDIRPHSTFYIPNSISIAFLFDTHTQWITKKFNNTKIKKKPN